MPNFAKFLPDSHNVTVSIPNRLHIPDSPVLSEGNYLNLIVMVVNQTDVFPSFLVVCAIAVQGVQLALCCSIWHVFMFLKLGGNITPVAMRVRF